MSVNGQFALISSNISGLNNTISQTVNEFSNLKTNINTIIKEQINKINLPKTNKIQFILNGATVSVSNPDPKMSLVNYLRNYTRFVGTKKLCNQGGCGVCAVMISYYDKQDKIIRNVSVNSCLMLLVNCDGKVITTTEGIGSAEKSYHSVQERIAKTYGLQCGACTAGMVMTQYTTLQPNTFMQKMDPTLIEKNFDGNLCRCPCYIGIIKMSRSFLPIHQIKDSSGNITGYDLSEYDGQGTFSDINTKGDSYYGVLKSGQNYLTPYGFVDNNRAFSNYDSTKDINGNNYKDFLTTYSPSSAIFDNYVKVSTINELIDCAKINPSNVYLVAGATSYGVPGYERPSNKILLDVNEIQELQTVDVSANGATFGARVPINKVVKFLSETNDNKYKKIADHLFYISGNHVRNLASICGSLVMAKKGFASDVAPLLIAGNATLRLLHIYSGYVRYEDNVPVLTYLNDNDKTKLTVIINIFIPSIKQDEYYSSFRVALRFFNAHAIINCAFSYVLSNNKITDQSKIVFGALTNKIPQVATITLSQLVGLDATTSTISGKLSTLLDSIVSEIQCNREPEFDTSMQPDAKGNYRKSLIQNLFYTSLLKLLKDNVNNPVKPSDAIYSGVEEWIHKVRNPNVDFQFLLEDQSPIKLYPIHFSMPKTTAINVAAGEVRYTDDNNHMNGELFCAIATSTIAVGEVNWTSQITIDNLNKAKNTPGITGVLTFLDVPGNNILGNNDQEEIIGNKYIYYYGSPVAYVYSESEELAMKVAKELVLDYKNVQTDFCRTIDEAIAKNKMPTKPYINAVLKIVSATDPPFPRKYGDGAFELNNIKIDVNNNNLNYDSSGFITDSSGIKHISSQYIVSDEYNAGDVHHFYLEKQCANGYNDENGRIIVYLSTQQPKGMQTQLLTFLNTTDDKVDVRCKRVGGAYGGKLGYKQSYISLAGVALGVLKLKLPVRCVIPVEQDMVFQGGRGEQKWKYKVGFNVDGKINSLMTNYYGTCGNTLNYYDASGNYLYKNGEDTTLRIPRTHREIALANETYNGFDDNIPNISFDFDVALIPRPGRCSYRSAGHGEGAILQVQMIDSVAGMLSKNLGKQVFFTDVQSKNLSIKSPNYQTMYNILTTDPKFNYVNRLANIATFNKNNKYIKRGIAIQDHMYVSQTTGSASGKDTAIKLKTNGNVHIWPCHVDMGCLLVYQKFIILDKLELFQFFTFS